ncbi:YbaB/EbfC family nucleoid-associated protein [soil metagenome]
MFDPAMIRKLQKDLSDRVEKMKEDLGSQHVEGVAGGGVVVVRANGNSEIQEVRIKPEAVDPDDVEMLQDLVLAAVNQALEAAKKLNEASMAGVTGGLKLPPGIF